MWKKRLAAVCVIVIAGFLAWGLVLSERGAGLLARFPFRYGLDIKGGSHLVYEADMTRVAAGQESDAMASLRDVIERRVNLFGVSETLVQTETTGGVTGAISRRLIVDLPGVTDTSRAIELIGQTPTLVFKMERPDGSEKTAITAARTELEKLLASAPANLREAVAVKYATEHPLVQEDPSFVSSTLTGAQLKRASLVFDNTTNQPKVLLEFTDEGQALFASITKANVGKQIAIELDGNIIEAPIVREPILDGKAEISGKFTLADAKTLVGRLNAGALPVPITLLSTDGIGATLGQNALHSGVRAGLLGVAIVALFLVLWYRLPGLVAVVALSVYVLLMLAVFKLIPVTLTAAGIAGFILSIGMAVDANILIFERLKEEMREGKDVATAMHDGFARAWLSIRDSNVSSMISAAILFWFGTSLVKGFALTLGLGVAVSMFSAITISRIFLVAVAPESKARIARALFGSGLR